MSSEPRIPDKQYFRIGEVARLAGVQPHVLRFWETEFGALRPSKTSSNRRSYSRRDVELVLRIRELLYEKGYTIAGARRQLREPGTGTPDEGGEGEVDEAAAQEAGAIQTEIPPQTRALLQQIRNEVAELLQLVQE